MRWLVCLVNGNEKENDAKLTGRSNITYMMSCTCPNSAYQSWADDVMYDDVK